MKLNATYLMSRSLLKIELLEHPKNLRRVFLILLAGLIFLAGSVLADFSYIKNNLVKNYSAGETIRGTFNIDLYNEPASSVLTSNFDGNISLIDFLNANNMQRGDDYECSTPNCENGYESQGAASTLSIQNEDGGSVVGFKISGQNAAVTSASLNVISNAPASCVNQLFIDAGDDNDEIIINNNHLGESCGITYRGCFDSSVLIETAILSDRKFCEKINLPSAPGFIVGAKIRNGTSGQANSNLNMYLYDGESNLQLGGCTLPRHSQELQELNCIINYSSQQNKDYFVCVSSSANSGYKIGWETSTPKCGTVVGGSGAGFSSLDSDFDIFAQSLKFAGFPSITLNNGLYQSQFNNDLSSALDEYLLSNYGRDCDIEDCIIPIKFYGIAQTLQFSSANLAYETNGITANQNTIYKLLSQEPKIDGENLTLEISKANFVIPVTSTANKFELSLASEEVFETALNIRRSFIFDVNPKVVPFGQSAVFRITSNENIINSTWNFGDGSQIQNINGNQTSHAYVAQNAIYFDINVTAYSTRNISAARTFRIYVGDPRLLANSTLKEYRKRINNTNAILNAYPAWIKTALSNSLNVNNLDASLQVIEEDYENAVDEGDFREVMLDLISLKIPKNISATKKANSSPLAITFESMNVEYIERISNEESKDPDELKNRIAGWMNANFNAQLSFEQLSAVYDYENEVLLSKFKIETKPIEDLPSKVYLIFGQNIAGAGGFKEGYGAQAISGLDIDYIEIDNANNQIFEFFIEGEIEAADLGAYLSKEVEEYGIVEIEGACNLNNICESDETSETCPKDCSKKWIVFTALGWAILFVFTFIFYIILQEWYKRNYEKKLFHKENELYNLINFIYNARKSGLNDGQIKNKLKESHWNGEKINYAFRKIDGKRLGMFEIPFFKSVENKKVAMEIARRQSTSLDLRFVHK